MTIEEIRKLSREHAQRATGVNTPVNVPSNYKAYLDSAAWKAKRDLVVAQRGHCEACGCTEHLHVHHLNYRNVGSEYDHDLQVLCHRCHFKTHLPKLIREGQLKTGTRDPGIRSRRKYPRRIDNQ